MSRAELIGYAAAACVFVTFYMKTMVPLRIAGIVSNVLFIAYGYDLLAYPVLILISCCCRSTSSGCARC
jgi:CRP/FNR family cyclic AMP-dependent transcriptional regulator